MIYDSNKYIQEKVLPSIKKNIVYVCEFIYC